MTWEPINPKHITYVKWNNASTNFEIEGIFRGIEPNKNYPNEKNAILDTSEGQAYLPVKKVLRDHLTCVNIGDRIKVQYKGRKQKEDKTGYYHDFILSREGPG
jgi:hypothetical protein